MRYRYSGPGGEREIKEPLPVRLAGSSWFLSLCTLASMAWAAYYLFLAHPHSMTGRQLSFSHRRLAGSCKACHEPFFGVPNSSCLRSDCHGPVLQNTIHDTLSRPCSACHMEHAQAGLLTARLENRDCLLCHRTLTRDPASPFYQQKPPRKITDVSSRIFKHRDHRDRAAYKRKYGKSCSVCHCLDLPGADPQREIKPINVPGEELFRMNTCLLCHRELKSKCETCHRYGNYPAPPRPARFYHQTRSRRLISPPCIENLDLMSYLKEKTDFVCTADNFLVPGFVNQQICETLEPAILFGESGSAAEP